MSSETTDNIAVGVVTEFDILAAASDFTSEELYGMVDMHMTDSTSHNRGIADSVAVKLNREDTAGQTFCTSHTTLGFDREIKTIVHDVEEKLGMENVFKGFLVNINLDPNQDLLLYIGF